MRAGLISLVLGLAAITACDSSAEPADDPRVLVLGSWYLSSCSVVSVADPTLTANCGPGHPTRLDVNSSYGFTTIPLPPDNESLSSSAGTLLLRRGQIMVSYDHFEISGTVNVLPGDEVMTWSEASDVRFENPTRILPAVVTIIWARSAP